MDFLESYYRSVHANKMANIDSDIDLLIPNIYRYSAELHACANTYPDCLHLLAGGNNKIEFPISFSFSPLNCYLLLYTDKGGGRISTQGITVSITEHQLLILDCNQAFTLQSLLLPWSFKLFFFNGKDMELFAPLLKPLSIPHFSIPDFSSIRPCINLLLSVNTKPDTYDLITMHQNITDILSALFFSLHKKKQEVLCSHSYLTELRDYLENHYYGNFSLNKCEELFGISKYRLCREFSKTYGIPPLKYLTQKRLEEAKKMLLTTDWTIHEISNKIGYENVNHFINLFKKDTGSTPNSFRQKALPSQSASHCPVQQIFPEA